MGSSSTVSCNGDRLVDGMISVYHARACSAGQLRRLQLRTVSVALFAQSRLCCAAAPAAEHVLYSVSNRLFT